MAIASRAERNTDHLVGQHSTPADVGPSSYVLDAPSCRPNFSGFSTSATRAGFVERESK
eukprot:CAMPEP_0118994484 /NCGR_PEP_ID=MMETSP1173-20130426/56888_1 /TAXON_ID=1034831 /ORGANISM="Rhizochromulina marina cf, Strain CCMP1243" /LENGTH=58 /DNA_ID=CAMNT_0006945773 /DNA_START=39 /DNA_END=212 /DNA_ORIENTATION=-